MQRVVHGLVHERVQGEASEGERDRAAEQAPNTGLLGCGPMQGQERAQNED